MKQENRTAQAESTKPSKIAEKTRKIINGYNDIQQFCQTKLQTTRVLEKDKNPTFELGYN